MKRTSRSLTTIAALTIGLFGAGSAYAAPTIVESWTYNLTAEWTAFAPNPGVSNPDPLTLEWGNPVNVNQSSLIITNPAADLTVNTYIGGGMPPAAFIAGAISLTHNNFVITGSSLTDATLTATLSLAALLPGVEPSFDLPPIQYDIQFVETPNQTPCASPSIVPCDDIFVQLTGLLNQSFMYDFDGTGLQEYFINIFPVSGGVLSVLSNAECAAAGAGPGCIGFSTPENESTTLAFGFTISTRPLGQVPEPGILALLGIGLAAGAFAGRRRTTTA